MKASRDVQSVTFVSRVIWASSTPEAIAINILRWSSCWNTFAVEGYRVPDLNRHFLPRWIQLPLSLVPVSKSSEMDLSHLEGEHVQKRPRESGLDQRCKLLQKSLTYFPRQNDTSKECWSKHRYHTNKWSDDDRKHQWLPQQLAFYRVTITDVILATSSKELDSTAQGRIHRFTEVLLRTSKGFTHPGRKAVWYPKIHLGNAACYKVANETGGFQYR